MIFLFLPDRQHSLVLGVNTSDIFRRTAAVHGRFSKVVQDWEKREEKKERACERREKEGETDKEIQSAGGKQQREDLAFYSCKGEVVEILSSDRAVDHV